MMIIMKGLIRVLAASAIMAVTQTGATEPGSPSQCNVRLRLHLTPDPADPQDQGFLDSLLGDPQYRLTWIRGTDTEVVVQLTGPATDLRCRDRIRRLGASSFILDVTIIPKTAR